MNLILLDTGLFANLIAFSTVFSFFFFWCLIIITIAWLRCLSKSLKASSEFFQCVCELSTTCFYKFPVLPYKRTLHYHYVCNIMLRVATCQSPVVSHALFTHRLFFIYFAFSFVTVINHRSDFLSRFTRHWFAVHDVFCSAVAIGSHDLSRDFHL